jgi:cytochrome c-type biogenesis protein CcmE
MKLNFKNKEPNVKIIASVIVVAIGNTIYFSSLAKNIYTFKTSAFISKNE